jgi:uncharacterized membrane protein
MRRYTTVVLFTLGILLMVAAIIVASVGWDLGLAPLAFIMFIPGLVLMIVYGSHLTGIMAHRYVARRPEKFMDNVPSIPQAPRR